MRKTTMTLLGGLSLLASIATMASTAVAQEKTIGVAVPNLASSFWISAVYGIEDEAKKSGTKVLKLNAGGDANSMLVSLLPFVLIFVIMYFLILRPQQKRVKQHQEMVKNVRRGDTVVTSGGLIGKVTKVIDDDQIEVELAEGVRIRQMRQMISDVRAKGEPVKDEA